MYTLFKKRALPALTALFLLLALFAGLPLSASAATPGVYTVTFVSTNASVQVGGSTVTSAQSDAQGDLTFDTPPAGTAYTVVEVSADNGNDGDRSDDAVVTKNSTDNYTISNVCKDLTVAVIAATPYTGQTADDAYTVQTAAQLAQIAVVVNAATPTPAVVYPDSRFYQIADIDLGESDTYGSLTWTGGSMWVPIGGGGGASGNVPNSNAFAGTYDGLKHSIDGMTMSLTVTSATSTGYGLFGFVNGGAVGNLTVGGTVTIGGSGADIAGIVGFTTGSLYNLISNVDVTASDSSNVGGVVGGAQNLKDSFIIQYCGNTGAIIAAGRVGGVIGGTYAGPENPLYIDRCYNTGNVTSTQITKTYAGGVVGYSCAAITNCYNTGDLTSGGTDTYTEIGGITGILVHYNTPRSSMANCYGTGSFYNFPEDGTYVEYLYGSADRDSDTPIVNSYWVANSTLPYPQEPFGSHTEVSAQPASALTPTLLGNAYTGPAPSVLDFTYAYTPLSTGGSVTPVETDDLTMFFLDVNAASGGTGLKASPFNDLNVALHSLTPARNVLYILSNVRLSADTSIGFDPAAVPGATIKRSGSYSGDLFTITGGTLTLGDDPSTTGVTEAIIVDGNKVNFPSAGGSLFRVAGGALLIDDGAALRNNGTQTNGGAIHIQSGGATLAGGSITDNNANSGGAVYINPGTTFTVTSGTLSGNALTAGGTGFGSGVYLGSTAATAFVAAPASGATFDVADTVYLITGATIRANASFANITGAITIQCQSPNAGAIVATCQTSAIANSIVTNQKIVYLNGVYGITNSGTSILLTTPSTAS
jgi:hypothetical protein